MEQQPTGPATRRRGVVVVLTDVAPDHEEMFNDWYDAEHVPERVALARVRSARRFIRYDEEPDVGADGPGITRGPKYLVIYELDDVDVLHDEWRDVAAAASPRSRAIYPHMLNLVRGSYVELGVFEQSVFEQNVLE